MTKYVHRNPYTSSFERNWLFFRKLQLNIGSGLFSPVTINHLKNILNLFNN